MLSTNVLLVDNTEFFNSARSVGCYVLNVPNPNLLRMDVDKTVHTVLGGRFCAVKIVTVTGPQRSIAKTMYTKARFDVKNTFSDAERAVLAITQSIKTGTLMYLGNNINKYHTLLTTLPAGWNLEIYTFEAASMSCISPVHGALLSRLIVRTLDCRITDFVFTDRCKEGVAALCPHRDPKFFGMAWRRTARTLGPIGRPVQSPRGTTCFQLFCQ
jgi:hypothetical protein